MKIRVCTYNVEWFDKLFDEDNRPLKDEESQRRLTAIETVLGRVDADIVGVVEGPDQGKTRSTTEALVHFAAAANLRLDESIIGFPSAGKQELALWYDSSRVTLTHQPGGSSSAKRNPRFDRPFEQDTDDDRIKEIHKHYRPPLEAKVTTTNGGVFYLLLVHAKSKYVSRAVALWQLKRESERNRRKLFAQASSIRKRVVDWLDAGRDFIVMGDVNDGPGMDFYEQSFGRSALEMIMGDVFEPKRILGNLAGRPSWGKYGSTPSSARFRDRITEDMVNVHIDHVLHSPEMDVSNYRIWNPFELEELEEIKSELIASSDHFPVSLDVTV